MLLKLLDRAGDIAPRPSQGKGGPNDQGQAKLGEHLRRFVSVRDTHTAWHDEPNLLHDLLEQVAIFGFLDRLQFGANELDPIALKHPRFCQGHGQVEGSLTAHSRQEGLRAFAANNFFQHIGGEWLQVGPISQFWIGHNRGGIAVHQHDAIALFLESFTGLCTGIIKLTGLANYNWTGANEENFCEILTFGHSLPLTNGATCWQETAQKADGHRAARAMLPDETAQRTRAVPDAACLQ